MWSETWHLENRRIHHFLFFLFLGIFQMRSQQDTHETEIRYDREVTQHIGPQKQKRTRKMRAHRPSWDEPGVSEVMTLEESK